MEFHQIIFTIITTIVTAGSLVVAIMALMNSRLQSNTKKYEMQRSYYCEVLEWYAKTILILSTLKHLLIHDEKKYSECKIKLLSELSTQIEIGRFYFPNKEDEFGEEKPAAYRGLRNIVLDYLVFTYELYEQNDADPVSVKYLDKFQREFTSEIFGLLNPKDHIEHLHSLTDKTYYKNWSIDDILEKDPEYISRVIKS